MGAYSTSFCSNETGGTRVRRNDENSSNKVWITKKINTQL